MASMAYEEAEIVGKINSKEGLSPILLLKIKANYP